MAITNKGGYDDLNATDDSLVPDNMRDDVERERHARTSGPQEFVAEEPGQADLRAGHDTPTSQSGTERLGD